jgi:hypothetical protein
MAYENCQVAKEAVYTAIGINDQRFDGMWVCVDITEMYTSGWRQQRTGRFQARISSPYRGRTGRDTILRTRKELNNEFDMVAIKAAVVAYVTEKKRQDADDKARMETVASNRSIVKDTKALYQGKTYVSDYFNGTCAIYSSEHEQGKVRLKWDFGSVDAETAAKIMNLINEIGA